MTRSGRVRGKSKDVVKRQKDRESQGKFLNIFCDEFSGVLVAYINNLKR